LQVSQLVMMQSMRSDCPAACQNALQRATLGLQERSVLIGTLIMALTSVVVVAWVVALRGGRLRLASARTGRSRGTGVLDRLGLTRTLLVSGLVGGAVVHAAVVPEHLAEWTAAGVFFVLLTAFQLGLAAAVIVVPRDRLLQWACFAASIGPLPLWLVSRTAGMPFGPEPGVPEPVGLADVTASALEVVTAVAALALLRSRTGALGPRPAVHGVRLAVVLVVAVAALGLGGTSLRWVGFGAGDVAPMGHPPSATTTGPPPSGPLNAG
ncbi:MAG: hypothetical protein LC713_06880, partial [Actinobacteria bacterium]|nr:hypothetical protein [Actinomycetota bacterium]